MKRAQAVDALLNLADSLGGVADDSEWYLFGSLNRDEATASDVDLLILCTGNEHADALRKAINLDSCGLPLHLSLMTYEEAAEVDAVGLQQASRIRPSRDAQVT
jgi:predicted nucleotidyltransferase